MIAGAAGQQNLYSWSLDETARERPVAKQLTTTAGAKADVSFSPDSKEVFYLDDGRIYAVTLDQRETRAGQRDCGDGRGLREGKVVVFDQAWRLLRDHFFDPAFNGVDWAAARASGGAVHRRRADARTKCAGSPSLMIGELNASHLGINPPPAGAGAGGGRPPRARLRSREYEASGALKIAAHRLARSVGARRRHRARPVPAGGGRRADGPRVNLDALLENKVNRRTVLRDREDRGGRGRRVTCRSARCRRRPSAGCGTGSGSPNAREYVAQGE